MQERPSSSFDDFVIIVACALLILAAAFGFVGYQTYNRAQAARMERDAAQRMELAAQQAAQMLEQAREAETAAVAE